MVRYPLSCKVFFMSSSPMRDDTDMSNTLIPYTLAFMFAIRSQACGSKFNISGFGTLIGPVARTPRAIPSILRCFIQQL